MEADEILFGGGRGGGKTDAGIVWMVEPEYLKCERYRGLVIRRNAEDLKDWVDRAQFIYQPTGAEFVGSPTTVKFPDGPKLRTGHLKDEFAYSKYQGHEYQKMLFEELTHIPRENDYEKLLASNRSTIPGLKPKSFATTNADGPGFKWVKQRFQIPDHPTKPVITIRNGRKLVFIPSVLEDNPILMENDPGYANKLEGMSDEDIVKAWRWGVWTGISLTGAYYANQIELLKSSGRLKIVPYDEALAVHTVWDLGVGSNLSVGFYQKTMNELRKIDYWEGTEKDGIPQAIKALQNKPYLYGKHFAPHDIKATEIGSGKTRVALAADLGLDFEGIIVNDKFVSAVPDISVSAGIEKGRQVFSHLWVDDKKCADWVDAMGQYRQGFNEKLGYWTGKPVHDWTCFTGDTKVLTHNGIKRIMELEEEDLILTSNLWQRQTNVHKTRLNAELVEVHFNNGTKVKCTLDHLFLTENGWKYAKNLEKGTLTQSTLTLSHSILMVVYGVYGLVASIIQKVIKNCTELFGKMRLVKYLKVVISTTKIVIQRIMLLKILNVLMLPNTYQTLGINIKKNYQKDFQKKQEKKQQNGINQRLEDCGIADKQKEVKIGQNGKEKQENARTVGMSIKVLYAMVQMFKNSVIQIVRPLSIVSVKRLKDREDVWDFCVPNGHHFSLENGAIVHNSHKADEYRYAALVEDQMTNDFADTGDALRTKHNQNTNKKPRYA